MNLLIHDFPPSEREHIRNHDKDTVIISDSGTINPCIGCFHCWISGSGECAFKDGYHNMGKLIHEAEEVTIMSRYTYGGFSSFVKNVFDRSIGFVLPEFETAYGEMHHQKRYPEDKPVTFIFRGHDLGEEDREKARKYVAALCRNLRGRVKDVIFAEAEEETDHSGHYAPKERAGMLMIDCSLRGEKANTRIFLNRLREFLMPSVQLMSLKENDRQEITDAVSAAETVIIGVPLYVDGLPSQAIRLMDEIRSSGAGRDCRLYALVNNGLYESRQNENLLAMIRTWCRESGIEWRGALAIGAGEVMGILMRGRKRYLWPVRNALKGMRELAEKIRADEETADIYADPYLFPRWLYILIANVNWQLVKGTWRRKQTIHQKG